MKESPAVSMLWESADPGEQLTRRFAFRDADSAVAWVADALRTHWQLPMTGCDRVVISAWNAMAWVVTDEGRFIAKWSALPQLFARLDDAARVVAWLGTQGIPVASPIPAGDGRLLVKVANTAKGRLKARLQLPGSRFLLGVLPVVEGNLLDVGDAAQVAAAGQMLAVVHEALAAYPHQISGRTPGTHEQLVHNDFRSANILCDGTRITAVLDFEEVIYDSRVADLAKAAVCLGNRYRDFAPTTQRVREVFVTAYNDNAQRPLTAPEQHELDEAITMNLKEKG